MKNARGISPVISTVIITATLLVILIIASYFATNLLELQVQNSEFEQAKTAMMILDKTISDVALRTGAASSIPFNQRSGGIGIYDGGAINIKIFSNSTLNWSKNIDSYIIKYRGGMMVTTVEAPLTKPVGLIVTDASQPLGYVRVEIENGVWVVLDYNRVRVTVNHDTKVMDIYFIHIVPGTTGGSGTVTVRVQNNSTDVKTIRFDPYSYVRVHVEANNQSEHYPDASTGVLVSVVRFIEVNVEVSTM